MRMEEKNVSTNEIMDFLQEHMVTREEFNVELKDVRSEMKEIKDIKIEKLLEDLKENKMI